jgi:mono/diheme cytochrome c family protein
VSLKGDGPVAARFLPPPDLLGSSARGRRDGFIYSYIRNGGAVMPSYGAQVTAQEAWDLVNYLRHQQRTNPR